MYENFQKREHISSEIETSVIKKSSEYNENLTIITASNPNSNISHFGYFNGFLSERGENYCTKIICIKYKDKDEWRKIYQYKFEKNLMVSANPLTLMARYFVNMIVKKYVYH